MTMNYSPVFLIASERSGTNLFRKKLTENQNIYFGPAPAQFFHHLYYKEPYYGMLDKKENFLMLIADALKLCYTHFSPWEIQLEPEIVYKKYNQKYNEKNVVLLFHFLMQEYAEFKGFKTYLCKDIFMHEFVYPILMTIPDVKFIYMYRDPRDFVLSQKKRELQTKNIHQLAKLWQYEQTKSISLLYRLEKNRIMKFSYEDFIKDEKSILKNVAAFLNVKLETGNSNIMNLNTGTSDDWKNLNKETMSSNYNKYKKELNKSKIQLIESICWEEMNWLGYKPENKSRPKISRAKIIYQYTVLKVFYLFRYFLLRKKRLSSINEREKLIKKLRHNWKYDNKII